MLEPAASGANPVIAEDGLSHEPEAYVGVFTNADWGAVEVRLADRMLVGVIGDLSLTLGTLLHCRPHPWRSSPAAP